MGVNLNIRALVLSMVLKEHDLLGELPDILFLLDLPLHTGADLLGDVLGDPPSLLRARTQRPDHLRARLA